MIRVKGPCLEIYHVELATGHRRGELPSLKWEDIDLDQSDLRHTFTTLALQNGVDIKTVSGMLGHFSAGFTLDTYAHVMTEAQKEAAKTKEKVLTAALQIQKTFPTMKGSGCGNTASGPF